MDKMSEATGTLSKVNLPAFVDREHFGALLQQLFSPAFYQGYRLVNQLCLQICLKVIAHYQLFAGAHPVETRVSIARKIGLAREADYLLESLLRLLVEEQYLVRDNQTWRPIRHLESPNMLALYRQVR